MGTQILRYRFPLFWYWNIWFTILRLSLVLTFIRISFFFGEREERDNELLVKDIYCNLFSATILAGLTFLGLSTEMLPWCLSVAGSAVWTRSRSRWSPRRSWSCPPPWRTSSTPSRRSTRACPMTTWRSTRSGWRSSALCDHMISHVTASVIAQFSDFYVFFLPLCIRDRYSTVQTHTLWT